MTFVMDFVVFSFLCDSVDGAINIFVTQSVQNVIAAVKPLAQVAVALYVAIYGWMVMFGRIQEPASDAILKMIKIILIAVIGLTYGTYNTYVVDVVKSLEGGIVQLLQPGAVDTATIYQELDKSFTKGMDLVNAAWDKAGVTNFGFFIISIIIAIAVVGLFLIAAGIIIAAKIFLSILLALGPLVILGLLFPVTARFFDAWLSQIINYLLTMAFAIIMVTLAIKIMERTFVDAIDYATNPLFLSVQILIVGGVMAFLLRQVPSLASGVAGGISVQSAGLAQMFSPATAAVGFTAGVFSGDDKRQTNDNASDDNRSQAGGGTIEENKQSERSHNESASNLISRNSGESGDNKASVYARQNDWSGEGAGGEKASDQRAASDQRSASASNDNTRNAVSTSSSSTFAYSERNVDASSNASKQEEIDNQRRANDTDENYGQRGRNNDQLPPTSYYYENKVSEAAQVEMTLKMIEKSRSTEEQIAEAQTTLNAQSRTLDDEDFNEHESALEKPYLSTKIEERTNPVDENNND